MKEHSKHDWPHLSCVFHVQSVSCVSGYVCMYCYDACVFCVVEMVSVPVLDTAVCVLIILYFCHTILQIST